MIGIIDYGVGNIQAFLNCFKRIDVAAYRVNRPEDLGLATHFILPGVGHFDHAMQQLNASGLVHELEKLVIDKKIPLMGVCVGMQMLGTGSDEGDLLGLGWLTGHSCCFSRERDTDPLRLPHMGWNSVVIQKPNQIFPDGTESNPQFYFLHSFHFEVENQNDVLATSIYGHEFASFVAHENIYGVQCHPEKSHHWGAQLLKNFAEIQ